MQADCAWCDGSCTDADLAPLLSDELGWLWQQVAARADRDGDPDLVAGTLRIRAPASAAARSAAVGLLGGRALRAEQTRTVDLAELAVRIRIRGADLTPGAVAAHASRRRLGVRRREQRGRRALDEELQDQLRTRLAGWDPAVRRLVGDDPWARLRAGRLAARLLQQPAPADTLARALDVAETVLERRDRDGRIDRRLLVPGDPHALDHGQLLAALVLTLGQAPRGRAGWSTLGVDSDNLVGGLLGLGIHPASWSIPAGVVVTIPPRELESVVWPAAPGPDAWVFVTENPSVVAAATRTARARLLCTVGTPSDVEAAAVGRLVDAGWSVAVRADFDPAGLFHVRTLLAAAPSAVPWRMGVEDYRSSSADGVADLVVSEVDTPWDPVLATAMTERGTPAYEEDLMDALMSDLARGQPG